MAKFQTVGMEEAIADLASQGEDWEKYAGKAVFEGARIVADEVRRQLDKIPVRDEKARQGKAKGLRPKEIQGLKESLGVAKAQRSGDEVNVLIGFDGYNANGKANSLVARSLQSGTYFLQKYPFMTYAVNATKSNAMDAMASAFEKQMEDKQ